MCGWGRPTWIRNCTSPVNPIVAARISSSDSSCAWRPSAIPTRVTVPGRKQLPRPSLHKRSRAFRVPLQSWSQSCVSIELMGAGAKHFQRHAPKPTPTAGQCGLEAGDQRFTSPTGSACAVLGWEEKRREGKYPVVDDLECHSTQERPSGALRKPRLLQPGSWLLAPSRH
jgi:hypothetical protein